MSAADFFQINDVPPGGWPKAELQAQVREFHEAFGQPVLDKPQSPGVRRAELRMRLIDEEAQELHAALFGNGGLPSSFEPNIPEVADALGDLLYVVMGTALEFGIDMGPVLAEIHRSNMAKLGPDGKPILDANGKVAKPQGWTPPDIAGVLRRQGWEP